MTIRTDYIDKSKLRVDDVIHLDFPCDPTNESLNEFISTDILDLEPNLIGVYKISDSYQLLPIDYSSYKYFINPNAKLVDINCVLTIGSIGSPDNIHEVINLSYEVYYNDVTNSGLIISDDLSNAFNKLSIEMYKIGLCKYTNKFRMSVSIVSENPTSTFTFKSISSSIDHDNEVDYNKTSISNAIQSYVNVCFSCDCMVDTSKLFIKLI